MTEQFNKLKCKCAKAFEININFNLSTFRANKLYLSWTAVGEKKINNEDMFCKPLR